MDLDEHAPMRTRAEAAERLVLSGAIAAPALFAAYRSGEPAASGGVWDRAQAVQALDAALAAGTGVGPALAAADAALTARGLRVALAEDYGVRLAALDPASARRRRRGAVLAELLLLAGEAAAAERAAGPAPEPRMAELLAIAGAGAAPPAPTGLAAAALAGLGATEAADGREARARRDACRGPAGRGDPRRRSPWSRPAARSIRRRCGRR